MRAFSPRNVLACLVVCAATTAVAAPRIAVVDPFRQMGLVPQGATLDLDFEVRNQGDETLEIEVRPSCGCTVATADSAIEPGDTGTIHAELDTSEFTGKISKSIMVIANDPEVPVLRLVVSATVQPALEVRPAPLVHIATRSGHGAAEEVTIAATRDDAPAFSITEIASNVPWLRGHVLGPDGGSPEPAREHRLVIEVAPDAPPGMVRVALKVSTDLPGSTPVEIRAMVQVGS